MHEPDQRQPSGGGGQAGKGGNRPAVEFGNRCAGQDLGDRIARGYVTVDTVNNCTLRFPGDAGYFGELLACSVRSRAYLSKAWNLASGFWSVTFCEPRTTVRALRIAS